MLKPFEMSQYNIHSAKRNDDACAQGDTCDVHVQ